MHAQVYTLLTNNYVEDDDAMFRFDYSPAFLAWALQPPGYIPSWHVGTCRPCPCPSRFPLVFL